MSDQIASDPIGVLRRALYIKKLNMQNWGTSKKQGSRSYLTKDARRAQRKQEKLNRKAGRV